MMPRIAIAGFQHETNSFGAGRAGLAEFEMADSWPRLLSGAEVVSATSGMNLPIAGFAAAATQGGAKLCPVLWCAAEPSGPVTQDAFETIATRIIEGIKAAGPIDGIYLDLHGAMITDHLQDGEGEFLHRLRTRVGPALPVAISLDMHANISSRMVELVDDICIFRTYPHLDMARTGARSWDRLYTMIEGPKPARAFRQGRYLIPLHAQQTGSGPARALYAALLDRADAHVELAMGFTAGASPDRGPSVVAHATTRHEAERLADEIMAQLHAAEPEFHVPLATPDEAVARAMAAPAGRPVILADVQDNPGAGASSDTTGLLRALVRAGAQGVIMGLMHDPALVQQAHAAGEGAEIEGRMGGRFPAIDDAPFHGRFRIERIDPGELRYTGVMYGGGIATLGPSCVLRILDTPADLRVVVTSIRNQCLDRAQFTHFGLHPEQARIVCVKSTAHFRADFEPIAQDVIPLAAPGAFPCHGF